MALTLRFLAGLSTTEVAAAFLVPVVTISSGSSGRNARSSGRRIPFRVPEADELRRRLPGVLTVVYLVFTEGYATTAGDALVRPSLADEAIRLARVLHRLLPDEREVTGLLALLLLTDARGGPHRRGRPAGAAEGPGPSALGRRPDRARAARSWSRRSPAGPGPYAVQAAISAVHDEAPDVASTDWPQIVALYTVLQDLEPHHSSS